MARCRAATRPQRIDAYLLINALVIVTSGRPGARQAGLTFSLVMAGTFVATVAILAVARLLWRAPHAPCSTSPAMAP